MQFTSRTWTYALLGVLLTICVKPSHAQSNGEPVTARIRLGAHEGAARPTKHGHAKTLGGNIEITQPAPDTVVVRMNGNVAASGSPLAAGSSSFDFMEQLQFSVEFSDPTRTGRLLLQAELNGLLVSNGRKASAGIAGASVTVSAGPQEVASLAMPQRIIGGCDSVAVNLSNGPICVPIHAGCYGLQQQFQIMASQAGGCISGGKATAEFSPASFSSSWQGSSYPFGEVDRKNLGYTVTIRVISDPLVTSNGVDSSFLPAPPLMQNSAAHKPDYALAPVVGGP